MSLDPKPARRLLDEPAAWRRMAKRLDVAPADLPFNSSMVAVKVGEATWRRMYARIIEYSDLPTLTAYDEATPENRAAGVLACLFLALEAEDEALP